MHGCGQGGLSRNVRWFFGEYYFEICQTEVMGFFHFAKRDGYGQPIFAALRSPWAARAEPRWYLASIDLGFMARARVAACAASAKLV